jgi:hypothetical protein
MSEGEDDPARTVDFEIGPIMGRQRLAALLMDFEAAADAGVDLDVL